MKRIIISNLNEYDSHDELLEDIIDTLEKRGWAPREEIMEEFWVLLHIKLDKPTPFVGEA